MAREGFTSSEGEERDVEDSGVRAKPYRPSPIKHLYWNFGENNLIERTARRMRESANPGRVGLIAEELCVVKKESSAYLT